MIFKCSILFPDFDSKLQVWLLSSDCQNLGRPRTEEFAPALSRDKGTTGRPISRIVPSQIVPERIVPEHTIP